VGFVATTISCGDGANPVGLGTMLRVELDGLAAMQPNDGVLHVWIHPTDGLPVSVGSVAADDVVGGRAVFSFEAPLAAPASMSVSLEAVGADPTVPSPYTLLTGPFDNGRAVLSIREAVTDGRPLVENPGAHSLFTSSNNLAHGYPSAEDAGIWLFTLRPGLNDHGTRDVRVIPLKRFWVYEGWVVRDRGTPEEIWVSYGKFRPDELGLLRSRDDTGSGPFSGDDDFVNGGIEDIPGEEWTTDEVAGLLGLSLPPGLSLPFDLDAVSPATGDPVWTHVITIEPASDEGETLLTERPFLLRPYFNPIGEGRPGDPRVIQHDTDFARGEVISLSAS